MTWKIKENQLYSRFVDEEPTILSGKRWTTAVVNFKYCPSGLERARQIFTQFDGLKFHIWHEGFMPEYEKVSYFTGHGKRMAENTCKVIFPD